MKRHRIASLSSSSSKRVKLNSNDVQLYKCVRRGVSTEVLVSIIQFIPSPIVTFKCNRKVIRLSTIIRSCYMKLKSDIYHRHFLRIDRFKLRIEQYCYQLPRLPHSTRTIVLDITSSSSSSNVMQVLCNKIPLQYQELNHLKNIILLDHTNDQNLLHVDQNLFFRQRLTKYIMDHNMTCWTNERSNSTNELFTSLFTKFPRLTYFEGSQLCHGHWNNIDTSNSVLETIHLYNIIDSTCLFTIFNHLKHLKNITLQAATSHTLQLPYSLSNNNRKHQFDTVTILSECSNAFHLLSIPIMLLNIKECGYITYSQLSALRRNTVVRQLSLSLQDTTRYSVVKEVFESCGQLKQLEVKVRDTMKVQFYDVISSCTNLEKLTISIYYWNHLDGLLRNCSVSLKHLYVKCYMRYDKQQRDRVVNKSQQLLRSRTRQLQRIDVECCIHDGSEDDDDESSQLIEEYTIPGAAESSPTIQLYFR
jgi:hypothetical protein